MAERRTFTVEFYEDNGEVKEIRPPDGAKMTVTPLADGFGNVTEIVIPLELLRRDKVARMCVHHACQVYCW